jgi:penicillin V acylase-like amidase (Ntn superfamily)
MTRFLLLTLFLLIGVSTQPAGACTGIAASDGKRILVGNNEDWFNMRTKAWFIQPVNDRYGCVFFGFDNLSPQGGMNQKGLFFDIYALREREIPSQAGRPSFKRDLMKEMLVTCATVEEALTLIGQYRRDFLDRHRYF